MPPCLRLWGSPQRLTDALYSLAFTPLIVSYTVEILPYSLRAKGFNIFNFAISLSLIFNQYVHPLFISITLLFLTVATL